MPAATTGNQPILTPQLQAKRRKAVRRTTLVVSLIVLAFYFGFIVMMLVRGSH